MYSVEIYDDATFFDDFKPDAPFEKWAAVAVEQAEDLPAEMEVATLPAGLYAVFVHKGSQEQGADTYRYIFETWLPNSAYCLDNRPHFAVMGEKYVNNSPDSEEEIWIPIRLRK